jgi:hypothetical protein
MKGKDGHIWRVIEHPRANVRVWARRPAKEWITDRQSSERQSSESPPTGGALEPRRYRIAAQQILDAIESGGTLSEVLQVVSTSLETTDAYTLSKYLTHYGSAHTQLVQAIARILVVPPYTKD